MGKLNGESGDGWLAKLLGEPPPPGEEVPEDLADEAAASIKHLSTLPLPKEKPVFQVLQARLSDEKIYTYAALGSLVVCNPFKAVGCLSSPEDRVLRYKTPLTEEDLDGRTRNTDTCGEPHIWAVCRDAWAFFQKNKASVSFIIQGESGAGKTESAKHVMLYFSSGLSEVDSPTSKHRTSLRKKTYSRSTSTELTGRLAIMLPSRSGGSASVQEVMMCANPLTEALGNARTLRNDNSSRFGRFVKLFMSTEGKIQSSEISIYSLEKSRVVLQGMGERNFHVFYQVLSGVTDEQRQRHKLRGGPNDYVMLRSSGCIEVAGMDDGEEWTENVLPALGAIGIEGESLDGLISLVSATLLCGELVWKDETGSDKASCASPKELEELCMLLGVEPALLEVSLTSRKRVMPGGSIIHSNLTPKQASETTFSIARSVYEALFLWVVSLVNTMSKGSSSTQSGSSANPWIGVLDIFGFEAFNMNSLEQLFINYTNERLHQFFIESVYKRELAICKDDGITVNFTFQDNAPILQAIDGPDAKVGLGILTMLEEQCGLQSGTNEAFTQGCHNRFKKTPVDCYVCPKIAARERFEIKHSCCPVVYCTSAFREKNMDLLLPDCREVLLKSNSEFVRHIVGCMPDSIASGPKKAYIAGQFMKSVSSLFTVLRSSEPRFIKCVKSNLKKLPMQMEKDVVVNQLHTLSIIESLQTEKQGFTYKRLFKDFVDDNKEIILVLGEGPPVAESAGGPSPQTLTKKFLTAIGTPPPVKGRTPVAKAAGEVGAGFYAMGRTKVFMTAPMEQRFCWYRRRAIEILVGAALESQRCFLARQELGSYNNARDQLVALQARWRRLGQLKAQMEHLRRRRRMLGGWRAATRVLELLFHVRRVRRERQRRKHVGIWRGSTHMLMVLLRCQRERRRLQQLHNMGIWRSTSHWLWLFHRVRRERRLRRQRRLLALWRASAHMLCLRARSYRRHNAAIQVQRHARTFLQRDELRYLAKLRKMPASVDILRRVVAVRNARIYLLRCLHAQSVLTLRNIARTTLFREWLLRERQEMAVARIQRHGRGYLGRIEARRIRNGRVARACNELKVYLAAMRWRLRFAEYKRSSGYVMAGRALSASRALNRSMAFGNKNYKTRQSTPPRTGGLQRSGRQPARAASNVGTIAKKEPRESPPLQIPASRKGVRSTGKPLGTAVSGGALSPGQEESASPSRSPQAVMASSPSVGGASSASPTSGDDNQVLGVWLYGTGDRYRIARNQSGQLYLEEWHDNGQKMHAVLENSGGWFQGELSFSGNEHDPLGTFRVRYASSMGMTVSSFRAIGEVEWDTETVGRRAPSSNTNSPQKQKGLVSAHGTNGANGTSASANRSNNRLTTGAQRKSPRTPRQSLGSAVKTRLDGEPSKAKTTPRAASAGGASSSQNPSFRSPTTQLQKWLIQGRQEAHAMYSSGALASQGQVRPRGDEMGLASMDCQQDDREETNYEPTGGLVDDPRRDNRMEALQHRLQSPQRAAGAQNNVGTMQGDERGRYVLNEAIFSETLYASNHQDRNLTPRSHQSIEGRGGIGATRSRPGRRN